MVQGATALPHQITAPLRPQAAPVLHAAAALDTAMDRLNAPPTLVEHQAKAEVLQPVAAPMSSE